MTETASNVSNLQTFLPYIVSILCALISGVASYCVARKQAKSDMKKLEKQFALDLEKERELFKMEKEKMEIEHRYQMELKQKELDSALGNSLMSSVMTEVYEESRYSETNSKRYFFEYAPKRKAHVAGI